MQIQHSYIHIYTHVVTHILASLKHAWLVKYCNESVLWFFLKANQMDLARMISHQLGAIVSLAYVLHIMIKEDRLIIVLCNKIMYLTMLPPLFGVTLQGTNIAFFIYLSLSLIHPCMQHCCSVLPLLNYYICYARLHVCATLLSTEFLLLFCMVPCLRNQNTRPPFSEE